ncbi:hypothetical protein VIBNIMADA3021_340018 [Vibrio nigripulchritudo MADA3021]|nr:hypothetical protein VIBNIMADA3021_340018 [Vibrio nigripulchritudo MADA3021]
MVSKDWKAAACVDKPRVAIISADRAVVENFIESLLLFVTLVPTNRHKF